MAAFNAFLNNSGSLFFGFASSMLIQSTVLIAALLVLDFIIRKRVRAIFRYCIWMLVLAKLVLPTSLSLPTGPGYWFGDKLTFAVTEDTEQQPDTAIIAETYTQPELSHPTTPAIDDEDIAYKPVFNEAYQPVEAYAADAVEAEIIPESNVIPEPEGVPLTWQAFVFLGWIAVLAAMVLLMIQRIVFVSSLIRQAKDADGDILEIFAQCKKDMGVTRKINLKYSSVTASPAVCGLFKPVILIPENSAKEFDPQHLRSILLHELAHIKRFDLQVSLVQTLLQIFYFYNPLLWLANSIIRNIREQAVDEMVLVAMGEDAADYPETLLNVSRMAFSRPALSLRLIGVVESKKALVTRIKHILSRPFPKSAKLGIAGLLTILITAAVLLPMAKGDSSFWKKRVPYDKELSTVDGVSLKRIHKTNSTSMSSGSSPNKECHLEYSGGTLMDILANGEKYPVIKLTELPEGQYSIKAQSNDGEEDFKRLICQAFTKAFDIKVSLRPIVTDVYVVTCPDQSQLTISKSDQKQPGGFYKHNEVGTAGYRTDFLTSIDLLCWGAGYFTRKAVSQKGEHLYRHFAFVNETNLEGVYEGQLAWNVRDADITIKSLRSMGLKVTKGKRKVEAIVIEKQSDDEETNPADIFNSSQVKNIHGTVRDKSGSPVEGALVLPLPHGGYPFETDSDGGFVMPGPTEDRSRWIVGLLARDQGNNLAAFKDIEDFSSHQVITLTEGAALTGRIVDTDGKPVPDANVTLTIRRQGEWAAGFGLTYFWPTNEKGYFNIDSLPVGFGYEIHVKVRDYKRTTKSLGVLKKPGRNNIGEIVLEQKASDTSNYRTDTSKLLEILEDEKYTHLRSAIIPLVEEIAGKDPIPFLISQLNSENRRRRCKAAMLMELLGDRRGVDALIKELKDTGYRPTEMIRRDGKKDQDGQVISDRYFAALVLGLLQDRRAVPALIDALQDKSIDYRAATSLGEIGDKKAIPGLRSMLQSSNKTFSRLFAGYGLAMLGDDEGLMVIIDTLNNQQENWVNRRHAIDLLGQLGNEKALLPLIKALNDKNPEIRKSSEKALKKIKNKAKASKTLISPGKLIYRIAENERKIQDIQLKMVCKIIEDDRVWLDYQWGYDHGKEFQTGIRYGKDRLGQTTSEKRTKTFDGKSYYSYYEELEDNKIRKSGSIADSDNMGFGGYLTFNMLMGYSSYGYNRASLSEILSGADSVTIKSKPEKVDGYACYVVDVVGCNKNDSPGRIDNTRLWLDAKRDLRILKREQYFDKDKKSDYFKQLRWRLENVKLAKVDGVWLPVQGERSFYSTEERLADGMTMEDFAKLPDDQKRKAIVVETVPDTMKARRLTIDSASIKLNKGIADERFKIAFPKGCEVFDYNKDITYIVGQPSEKESAYDDQYWIDWAGKLTVDELIGVLRDTKKLSGVGQKKVLAAIDGLIKLKSDAVEPVGKELIETENGKIQSFTALILRAIGDPKAVPYLIDGLERSFETSDYGFGSSRGQDSPLEKAYRSYQYKPSKRMLGLCRPVREITYALEKLTGHSEGQDHFHAYDSNGNRLGSYTITPEIVDRRKAHRKQVAERWRKWWQKNKQAVLSGEIPEPIEIETVTPVKKSGTKPEVRGVLAGPDGAELSFAIVPEIGIDISDAQYKNYVEQLKSHGPFRGSIRGDSFQWSRIEENCPGIETLPVQTYKEKKYVLLGARKDYVLRPEVEGKKTWGLTKAYVRKDNMGKPGIYVEFDQAGAKLFKEFTKANVGKRFAIEISWSGLGVVAAPVLQGTLGKSALITGNFTEQQAKGLVELLKKGMPKPKISDTSNSGWGKVVNGVKARLVSKGDYILYGRKPNINLEVKNDSWQKVKLIYPPVFTVDNQEKKGSWSGFGKVEIVNQKGEKFDAKWSAGKPFNRPLNTNNVYRCSSEFDCYGITLPEPGKYKAKVTFGVQPANGKTFKVSTGWLDFNAVLTDHVNGEPYTAEEALEEAKAYESVLLSHNKIPRVEAVKKFLSVAAEYPDSAYELKAYFHASVVLSQRLILPNDHPTREHREQARKLWKKMINKWPQLVLYETAFARHNLAATDKNQFDELLDFYEWLSTRTKEQKIASIEKWEDYFPNNKTISEKLKYLNNSLPLDTLEKNLASSHRKVEQLQRIITRFPGTNLAKLAKKRLNDKPKNKDNLKSLSDELNVSNSLNAGRKQQWDTIATSSELRLDASAQFSSGGTDLGTVVFATSFEKLGSSGVTVVDEIDRDFFEVRIVAIDKAGNVIKQNGGGTSSFSGVTHIYARFDIPLESIKRYRLQTRRVDKIDLAKLKEKLEIKNTIIPTKTELIKEWKTIARSYDVKPEIPTQDNIIATDFGVVDFSTCFEKKGGTGIAILDGIDREVYDVRMIAIDKNDKVVQHEGGGYSSIKNITKTSARFKISLKSIDHFCLQIRSKEESKVEESSSKRSALKPADVV